ncbi:MAG: GGDEF domain-containing protein, partial [Myxococcales bacterium]|nr:GGDEF domain-containing protein [Myxococcales bacterium]
DEFAILLPGVERHQARHLAERLRGEILANPAVIDGAQVVVSVSLGIGEYAAGDDANALIGRADRALYQAKLAGKNWIAVDEGAGSRTAAVTVA